MKKGEHTAPPEWGRALRGEWLLQEDMCYLNHGSYGATPKRVLVAQAGWRRRLERQPARFMTDVLPRRLRASAAALADFLGARAQDLAFVDNATAGVNTVLRSLPWREGDEIVLSNHAYGAIKNAVRYIGERFGVTVREIRIPFPLSSAEQITGAYRDALGGKTRLVLVDHVTSPSALVFPVEEIIPLCKRAGAWVLVDGAHAPGMLPLRLETCGADWYVGNCHKWLFAPKGCGFLWAAADAQSMLHPLVISNRFGEGYPVEFDWTGTRDPSAWLAVDAALDFYRYLGAERLSARNHELAIEGAKLLARAWGTKIPAPEKMFGAMVTVPLPGNAGSADASTARRIHAALWRDFRVEAPVIVFEERLWVRISAQAYNERDDYLALADGVLKILTR